MILGIDFGTCFSSVAFMNGQIPVTDYIKDPNKTGIPTLFMHSRKTGKDLYGYDCTTAEAIINSADVVRNIKRIIRENPKNLNMSVLSGGNSYTISEVVKKYLTYLITEARNAAIRSGEFTNTDIEAVTISSPIGISGGQMTATDYSQLLVDMVTEITGLPEKKVYVLQEPVSAAISYLYSEDIKRTYNDKETILVFDLGGGTLDVTVVEHDPDSKTYGIKAKEGDLKLGGNDWDSLLANDVLAQLGLTEEMFASPEELARFKTSITKLKQDLTDLEESAAYFKLGGRTKLLDYTRADFEKITLPLLDRAIDITKKAVYSYSKNGITDIDKIILVGGSSNMPQIRERMIAEFPALGDKKIITHDPSKAIAKGAAIFAKIAATGKPNVKNPEGKVIDIASHTYGFNCLHGDKAMIYNLLFKGTEFDKNGKISVTSKDTFLSPEDHFTSIYFVVYESDATHTDDEESRWMAYGTDENANGIQISVNIPDEYIDKATEYFVWVTFTLNKNGIFEMIITDKNGKRVGYEKKQL